MTPVNCSLCGSPPVIDRPYPYTLCCSQCHDGEPGAKLNHLAFALDYDDAIEAWNEMQAELQAEKDDERENNENQDCQE
jgi:hypothetical protein